MIISISGLPGSGKTTVGKILAKWLDYKFYSMGDIRGKMATERGMTIDELNQLGEKEEWTDTDVDQYQKELGEKENNFIVEGRLSFHFIPKSVKIFFTVDSRTGAERIFRDQRPDEEKRDSVEEVMDMLRERVESDRKRYKKYYGVDFTNTVHYDFVVDSTNIPTEEVVEKVMAFLRSKGLKD